MPSDPSPSRVAVYPGTFDPITLGHLDVIQRGVLLFDRIVVAVGCNAEKRPLFSAGERVAMVSELVRDVPTVSVESFDGLVVEFARQVGAKILLRGIRTLTDMEYEFTMALTNETLAPEIETVFLMADQKYSYFASHIIKQIAQMGGALNAFLPEPVTRRLHAKLNPGG